MRAGMIGGASLKSLLLFFLCVLASWREFLFFCASWRELFQSGSILPSGMLSDQLERSSGKRFSWFDAMPRRSAGGMRQRDNIETLSGPFSGSHLTDHFAQSRDRLDELSDSQFAHRNHQTGSKQRDLCVQPGRTILNFDPGRNSVTGGRFTRETTTHCGHVDCCTKAALIHARYIGKPFE